jgi:hypothetical protein
MTSAARMPMDPSLGSGRRQRKRFEILDNRFATTGLRYRFARYTICALAAASVQNLRQMPQHPIDRRAR